MDHPEQSTDTAALPPSAFVSQGDCLICGRPGDRAVIADVEDWFFGALPHASTFCRCDNCGSLWITNRLTEPYLKRADAQYYTHVRSVRRPEGGRVTNWLKAAYAQHRFTRSASPSQFLGAWLYRRLARNRVELDAAHRFAAPCPGRILDYGFGSGEYLDRMKALGHDVVGVDFDPVSINNAKQRGIEAYTPGEAEALDWQGRFDTITIAHVIEHVADPGALLARLAGWLRPHGVLFVEAPNAQAWGLSAFGRYRRGLEAPRHLAIPSRTGLEKLARDADLDIVQQVIRPSVRSWLWQESLAAVPTAERAAIAAALEAAPQETFDNAEFLTMVMMPSQDTP